MSQCGKQISSNAVNATKELINNVYKMDKLLLTLSLISNMLAGEAYGANAEENLQVSSSAGVVAGSVVCLIASNATFWYSSMSASEVKKEVVHQYSQMR